MNFRNRKKMDEFDDFSREMQEREKRKVREIEKYEAEEKASFSESDYDENREEIVKIKDKKHEYDEDCRIKDKNKF